MNIFAILAAAVCFANAAVTDKLIAVQLLYRHGDRSPLKDFPTNPYSDILYEGMGEGALTNAGKARHYKLGQWLRKRYNKFLSPIYSSKDLHVVSDDLDRCIMSAAVNLAGLYPPKFPQIWNVHLNWQPIPIHLNLPLLNGFPPNCPIFLTMLDEITATEEVEKIINDNQEIFDYLTKHSGLEVKTLLDLFYIRDTLNVITTRRLPLPKWAESVYPQPLITLSAFSISLFTYNQTIAQLSVGPLLDEILTNFENVTQKFRVYSGHDFDIQNLLNTLTTYPLHCPEFAAVIIFELWEDTEGKYVRVLYKRIADVEEVRLRDCEEKCRLEDFRNLVKPLVWSLSERDQKCAESR